MENLNLVELLRDCPNGMELDCTMFDNVTFVRVDYKRRQFPIEIAVGGLRSKYLTKDGCFDDKTLIPEAKCVIFPKGKTTWEGFVLPLFKNGDIVTLSNACGIHTFIYNNTTDGRSYGYYAIITSMDNFKVGGFCSGSKYRLATEEEKQKLFDAIKANGYRWNSETKTLEKLIEPKFKVGDKIEKCGYRFTIKEVREYHYLTKCGNLIAIANQDDFSLVPNKFDITTLKPFDKVLYRMHHNDTWLAGFYDGCIKDKIFVIGSMAVPYCIPYEGNEHLRGTTNDCDPFYKTWENNN